MLENYAKCLIQVGLHVKPNQVVVIQAPVEVYPFVQLLSKEAYLTGARDVIVRYSDEILSHDRYLYAKDIDKVPSYVVDFYNQTAQEEACYLFLVGDDSNLMKDVDPKRSQTIEKPFEKRRLFIGINWILCIVNGVSQQLRPKPGQNRFMAMKIHIVYGRIFFKYVISITRILL